MGVNPAPTGVVVSVSQRIDIPRVLMSIQYAATECLKQAVWNSTAAADARLSRRPGGILKDAAAVARGGPLTGWYDAG